MNAVSRESPPVPEYSMTRLISQCFVSSIKDLISFETPRFYGNMSPPPPSRKVIFYVSGKYSVERLTSTSAPSSSSLPTNTSTAASSSSSSSSSRTVIAISVGGVIFFLMLVILIWVVCSWKRRNRRRAEILYQNPVVTTPFPKAEIAVNVSPQHQNHQSIQIPSSAFNYNSGGSESSYSASNTKPSASPPPEIAFRFSKTNFTYEELWKATNGFSQENLLGQGGFGFVHKGVLPNGKEVAVKSLKSQSGQGEREFHAEIETITTVHHRHLVSLAGYCIAETRKILVYEYVPNKTLEHHLHGKGCPTMEWSVRMKIALGSAKGLSYLHEDCHPKIIHRDIKAANILLDENFEAMVADFGLAKFSAETNTHISTRVMGTFGYLAPEYASSGKLTDKSDIFSFGVMLLELITGKRPIIPSTGDSLVDWARPWLTRALETGNYDSLVDPRLENNFDQDEMIRMIACAAACVRHSSWRRPRMGQIVRVLEGGISTDDLQLGRTPGHSMIYESSEIDSDQYNENMKKFRKIALGSQDNGSSEYSGPTSEYGTSFSISSSEVQQTRRTEMKMKKHD